MTILAGAFAFGDNASLDGANTACWVDFFSALKDGQSQLQHVSRERLVVWKWDCGAYGEPAWQQDPDGSLATLCGDPLLTENGVRLARFAQLARLRAPDGSLDEDQLRATRGVFSVVAFSQVDGRLQVAGDLIGIRPLFYATQNGVFYFASAQHLLERLPVLARTVDHQGLAEHLTLGFSLADRTPYREVKLLPEAAMLRVDHEGPVVSHYFDWSSAGPSDVFGDNIGRKLASSFDEAVKIRLDGRPMTHAFLSGGMDSRSIVASIATQGCKVEAMNFSIKETQDWAFALAYAKTLGSHCNLTQHRIHNFPNFSMLARAALAERSTMDGAGSTVQQVWSGDGGSVCLGYVYLDDAIMHTALKGDWPGAADALARKNKWHVPSGLLSSSLRRRFDQALHDGIVSELQRYDNGDQGRRLYFFLLFNDQRRHLFKHFETIHEHRLELVLPFFDTQFIMDIVGTPAEWGIGHRLYGKFFDHFSPETRSVPWQTYPGHEPCPVKPDQSYGYQWAQKSDGQTRQSSKARKASASAMLHLLSRPALAPLLSKTHVAIAATLHLSGLRDYDYLASAAQKLASLHISAR